MIEKGMGLSSRSMTTHKFVCVCLAETNSNRDCVCWSIYKHLQTQGHEHVLDNFLGQAAWHEQPLHLGNARSLVTTCVCVGL